MSLRLVYYCSCYQYQKRFAVGVQTVEIGEGPKSLMEWSKGRQELGCCLVVCVMCCVLNSSPFMGCPTLPFIDQGGAGGLQMGERGKNLRWRSPFEDAELSFSLEPVPLSWQTVPEMARPLTLTVPRPGPVSPSVTSHPPQHMDLGQTQGQW